MQARKKLRWRGELTEALGDVAGGTHSGLERRYLRGVERPHGLPLAIRQARVVSGGHVLYRDVLYGEYAWPWSLMVRPRIRRKKAGSTVTGTTPPPSMVS
jgi:hypothetical protein